LEFKSTPRLHQENRKFYLQSPLTAHLKAGNDFRTSPPPVRGRPAEIFRVHHG
jgi:hypothetical protein